MALVNIRELSRRASAVVGSVAKTRRPALITRRGRPIAAVVSLDEEAVRVALEDWVLAHAPEFIRSREEAERDFAAGRTISLATVLERMRRREAAKRRAARKRRPGAATAEKPKRRG